MMDKTRLSAEDEHFSVLPSMLIYHLRDELSARWWLQFRDIAHPTDVNIITPCASTSLEVLLIKNTKFSNLVRHLEMGSYYGVHETHFAICCTKRGLGLW
jgi:hypothetical protein